MEPVIKTRAQVYAELEAARTAYEDALGEAELHGLVTMTQAQAVQSALWVATSQARFAHRQTAQGR